jgi:hypothetical protein
VVDFDVTDNGMLVFLTTGGEVIVAGDTDKQRAIPKAPGFPSSTPKEARVFVDADFKEISLYWSGRLGRFDTVKASWAVTDLDADRQAIVRTVFKRVVLVEPRLK